MSKKYCFFLATIICFNTINIIAQKRDTADIISFSIKLNPLQLAAGEARVISEFYFYNRNQRMQSIGLTSSYFSNYSLCESIFSFPDRPFSSRTGYKLGVDYKYYSRPYRGYINPMFFYSIIEYKNAYTASVDGIYLFWNNALEGDFIKQTYAFQLQKGWISIDSKNRLITDFYIGIGARIKYFTKQWSREIFSIHGGINIGFIKTK